MGTITSLTGTADATVSGLEWPGGVGTFFVQGDFNGATVSLNASQNGGDSYFAVGENTSFTVDGGGWFVLPQCLLEVSVSGGASPEPEYFITSADNIKRMV